MEPLFLPEDEESLLPKELHAWSGNHDLNGNLHVDDAVAGETSNRSTNGGGDISEINARHQLQQQRQLLYDLHSVHVVTQYYVPKDPQRAREVCGVQRLRLSVWCRMSGS